MNSATHFHEQYEVIFTDGTEKTVYVEVAHGVNEKNNHAKAGKIAKIMYPNKVIKEVIYA